MKKKIPTTFLFNYKSYPVYSISGYQLRKSLTVEEAVDSNDDDFLDYGINDTMNKIPKNTIWVAEELDKDERIVVIMTAAKRLDLLKNYSSDNARLLSKNYEKHIRHELFKDNVPDNVRTKLLETKKDIKIYLVSGKWVRYKYDDDFVQGGHGYVYEFVPKDEIWIDDTLNPKEYKPVIMHEYYEMRLT